MDISKSKIHTLVRNHLKTENDLSDIIEYLDSVGISIPAGQLHELIHSIEEDSIEWAHGSTNRLYNALEFYKRYSIVPLRLHDYDVHSNLINLKSNVFCSHIENLCNIRKGLRVVKSSGLDSKVNLLSVLKKCTTKLGISNFDLNKVIVRVSSCYGYEFVIYLYNETVLVNNTSEKIYAFPMCIAVQYITSNAVRYQECMLLFDLMHKDIPLILGSNDRLTAYAESLLQSISYCNDYFDILGFKSITEIESVKNYLYEDLKDVKEDNEIVYDSMKCIIECVDCLNSTATYWMREIHHGLILECDVTDTTMTLMKSCFLHDKSMLPFVRQYAAKYGVFVSINIKER